MELFPEIKKDFGTVFGLALAPAALCFEGLTGLVQIQGLANIFDVAIGDWLKFFAGSTEYKYNDDDDDLSPSDYINAITLVIQLLIALFGTCSILLMWDKGLRFLRPGFRAVYMGSLLALLSTVILGIFYLFGVGEGEPFQDDELIDTCLLITGRITLILIAWWVLSCYKSLVYVNAVGGTGWERLNYIKLNKIKRHNEDAPDVIIEEDDFRDDDHSTNSSADYNIQPEYPRSLSYRTKGF